jgi:glycerate 2-kinase
VGGWGAAPPPRAGRLIALVISDILGDPLDLIASGPTVVGDASPDRALDILDRYGARQAGISERVFTALERGRERPQRATTCRITNLVIANNATAVEAAAAEARRLGRHVTSTSASASEGLAEVVGRRLAESALAMRSGGEIDCLISGGEPTVKLVAAEKRGLGGRNQQLVLAAAERLQADGGRGIAILSAGTDGEDGPTDAAGAWVDEQTIAEAARMGLDPTTFLDRNDAYRWFEPLGALVKTGPTNTNVCDVRVVLVDRVATG